MAEVNLFLHERVELLDGVIVTKTPQNSPHAATVHRLLFALLRTLGTTAYGSLDVFSRFTLCHGGQGGRQKQLRNGNPQEGSTSYERRPYSRGQI